MISDVTGVNIATLSKYYAKWLRGTHARARLAARLASRSPATPPPTHRLRLVHG